MFPILHPRKHHFYTLLARIALLAIGIQHLYDYLDVRRAFKE